ncbi:MAG TPA: hypothetical protein VGG48_00805 [Rhizomicrobium sp.]|jgi:hypothetical protein
MSDGGKAHLYEAVANQRERVLTGFDSQRDAIVRAVDEQRMAAMAPIYAVQGNVAAGRPAGQPAAGRPGYPAPNQQSSVAADIVMTIKAMVAEEVRSQILALLQAADSKQRAATEAADAQPVPQPGPHSGPLTG